MCECIFVLLLSFFCWFFLCARVDTSITYTLWMKNCNTIIKETISFSYLSHSDSSVVFFLLSHSIASLFPFLSSLLSSPLLSHSLVSPEYPWEESWGTITTSVLFHFQLCRPPDVSAWVMVVRRRPLSPAYPPWHDAARCIIIIIIIIIMRLARTQHKREASDTKQGAAAAVAGKRYTYTETDNGINNKNQGSADMECVVPQPPPSPSPPASPPVSYSPLSG